MTSDVVGQGTAADPWVLKTPPGTSDYAMHKDEASPATPGVHRGQDHAVLPAPVPPGPSRDAARARRLEWSWGRPTSRNRPRRARSRRGVDQRAIRSAAGTA